MPQFFCRQVLITLKSLCWLTGYSKVPFFVLKLCQYFFCCCFLVTVLWKMENNYSSFNFSVLHKVTLWYSPLSVSSPWKSPALFHCYYYGRQFIHVMISVTNPHTFQFFLGVRGTRKADNVQRIAMYWFIQLVLRRKQYKEKNPKILFQRRKKKGFPLNAPLRLDTLANICKHNSFIK